LDLDNYSDNLRCGLFLWRCDDGINGAFFDSDATRRAAGSLQTRSITGRAHYGLLVRLRVNVQPGSAGIRPNELVAKITRSPTRFKQAGKCIQDRTCEDGERPSLTRAGRLGFRIGGKTRYKARSARVPLSRRFADFVRRSNILSTVEHISAHVAERSDEDSA